MKLIPKRLLLIFPVLLGLHACKDFIEPDIGKRQLNLLAPGDRYQSKSFAVNFWWDEEEDALAYRLQIVTPSFDSIGALVTDTLVRSSKFIYNMEPGDFQWRVRAENGSSQTAFSIPRNFTVLNSSIRQQVVQLAAPGNNALTNEAGVIFQWGTLYGATRYRLQVDTNNFADTARLPFNQASAALQANYTILKERQYQWRVRAENDTAQSKWSDIRVISYDHTPPAKVTLAAPENNLVVPLPVNLQWNTTSSASRYKLYVLKGDSTMAAYNASFPMTVTTTNYIFNLGNSGDRVYWKVSAIDAAGNEGQASNLQSFILQ